MKHAHGFPDRLWTAGAFALLTAIAAALGGCLGEKLAGSTSTGNTGKGTISGRVLNAKGEAVANARVRVVSVDHNPGPGGTGAGEVADVVLTAADGTFRTDSLADGLYNLLDEKAGQLSFQDSVAVDGDSASVAQDDVLRPPGSLAGVVRLQPWHDSRTVFLILPGTTTLVLPMDSVGNFRLANLAEGEYRLRILSTLDAYKPLDTLVTIVSGVQGILQDTLRLEYKAPPGGIPEIKSLRVAYDSIAIAATLTWNKVDPAFAASYIVYRKHRDSVYVRLSPPILAETAFVDDWTKGLRPGNHYEYAVTVVDPMGNEGRKTEAVPLNPGVRYGIGIRVTGGDCSMGICNYDVDEAGNIHVSESNGYVVRYGANGGTYRWKNPHFGAIVPSSSESGSHPIAADSAGGSVYMLYMVHNQPARLGKLDSSGNSVWVNSLPFDHREVASLHRAGDSLLVWRSLARVMTYLDLNGNILGEDTLMRFLQLPEHAPPPEYKPGMGFYAKHGSGILLLDRDGNLLVDWVVHPEPEWPWELLYELVDVDRDAEGRWYLSWGRGIVEVFTPDRIPLGAIIPGGRGDFLKFRNGRLFMETAPLNTGNPSPEYTLIDIVPGY